LVGHLIVCQLPLGVKRYADCGVLQEAGVAPHLREELAATWLEVQDQQQPVAMGSLEVARDRPAVDWRAVGARWSRVGRGDRGDPLEGRLHRSPVSRARPGLSLHTSGVGLRVVRLAEDVRRPDDPVVGDHEMPRQDRSAASWQLDCRRGTAARGGGRQTRRVRCPTATASRDHEPDRGHKYEQPHEVTPSAVATSTAQRATALQQLLARVTHRPRSPEAPVHGSQASTETLSRSRSRGAPT